jgi:ADP-heptose:LPS heptosyltransferase
LDVEMLRPLFDVPNLACFSLQLAADGESAGAQLHGTGCSDLAPAIHNFADTAAIVSRLDLVITVDTALAHLAGALGHPVWTLLCHTPDWRWQLERADSPWYPTMRLFRQPRPGDWSAVIDEVASELRRLAGASGGPR